MEYSAKRESVLSSVRDEDGHCAEVFAMCANRRRNGESKTDRYRHSWKSSENGLSHRIGEGETEDGLFCRLSSMNAVRREACGKLDDMRLCALCACAKTAGMPQKKAERKEESAPLLYIRLASAKQYSKELFDLADRCICRYRKSVTLFREPRQFQRTDRD
jgi:hypothetical protein